MTDTILSNQASVTAHAQTGSAQHAIVAGESKGLGPYAFDTVNLGPKWELSGGLRYDHFDVDYTSRDAAGVVLPFGRSDDFVS